MAVRIADGVTFSAPGRVTNPFQLQLNIDARLGAEKSRHKDDEGVSYIQCHLFPLADLSINHIVEFELILPRMYLETGGMRIKIVDQHSRLFFGNQLNEANELIIPWLEHAKYTLPVWFFAIREYFKQSVEDPWVGSILLRSEFRELLKPVSPVNSSSSSSGHPVNLVFGTGNTRGRRNYMEDVDFVFESIQVSDKRTVAVFGVLDGHGGKDCAQYAAEDVPIKITTFLRNSMPCAEALFKSFLETDKEFLESAMGGNSGSTANISIYDKTSNQFFVANTADTRAVLCRSGVALDLSIDRKATDPEEIIRITKAGGYVVGGRVLGCLAVSRAFGDSQLKNNKTGVLVVNPEISRFSPGLQDEFVVIATDGLWDVMSSQAVIDICREMLIKEELLVYPTTKTKAEIVQQLAFIANHIAVHAVTNLRSQDNVTVMIVLIQGGEDRSVQIAAYDEEELNIKKHHTRLLDEMERLKLGGNVLGTIGIAVSSSVSSDFNSDRLLINEVKPKPEESDTGADRTSSFTVVPTVATMIFKKQPSVRGAELGVATEPSHRARSNTDSSLDNKEGASVVVRSISTEDSTRQTSSKVSNAKAIAALNSEDDLMSFLNDDTNF